MKVKDRDGNVTISQKQIMTLAVKEAHILYYELTNSPESVLDNRSQSEASTCQTPSGDGQKVVFMHYMLLCWIKSRGLAEVPYQGNCG